MARPVACRQHLAQIFVLTAAAFLVLGATDATRAHAQCCGGFGAFGGAGFGYYPPLSYGRNLFSIDSVPVPPYFALHPPVYYGERVRRSYGTSPFAYPPHHSCHSANARVVQHPVPAPPEWVMNPFVADEQKPMPEEARSNQAAPQWVRNPYYEAEAGSQLAGTATP